MLVLSSVTARDTKCQSKAALGQAVDLWHNESVDVFIGPPCSVSCRAVAELASVFNVPIISWVATDPDLSDRKRYTTLARTMGPFSKVGMFLLEVFAQYNWQRVVVISSNYLLYWDAAIAIIKVLSANNVTIAYRSDYERFPTDKYILDTLMKTRIEGRIILLVSPKEDRRRFMLQALDLGMCDGDYVFYTVDMLPDEVNLDPKSVWKSDDGRNEDAKRAFESVFHVSLAALTGAEVDSFRVEVAKRLRLPPWNYTLNTNEKGNKYAAFLYDAVKLYAIALSEALRKGVDTAEGQNVVQNMKGKMFKGYSGNVVLDQAGDREQDYWILDMNPETGVFVKMAEVVNEDVGLRIFRTDLRPPYWPNGKVGQQHAPPDTPPCGFLGELCEDDAVASWVVVIIVVTVCSVVTAAVVIGVLLYRRSVFERNLLLQSWRVYYEDVDLMKKKGARNKDSVMIGSSSTDPTSEDLSDTSMTKPGPSTITASQDESTTLANKSLRSIATQGITQQQIFTDIGHYKGMVVGLKHIHKEHIQLNRALLVEFSDIKDLVHQNLNIFVGACVDPPNICLLWQYCPKGSLQDLLMNDEVKLDNNFRLSFMTDIAKGMEYILKSHLKSHGNLKSSNCLVDARWVVKLTDYGMSSLRIGQSSENQLEADVYRKKLWTAPELLRENFPPPRGSTAGDVYSFAIVCYEITFRTEPYSFERMTPRDVVNRVRNGETYPFRPPMPETSELGKPILDMIQLCWSESQELRPSFSKIRVQLRKLTRGEINIMDKIMEMMEMYSLNLKEIVEERTQQLAEEKKKTDGLLNRMLPASVADQLKAGQVIKPENYDQASIYFSDIVGFTEISAESNPMQIVDFLNDLYTCFDDTIAHHDVYKVETIGDAYMVVSGVPVRNGTKHFQEIANCSLDLLSAVTNFKIRHRPHRQLQIRVGLHSGVVVAGVVGLIMPRYCLFGDTVNMTIKMESSGKPLRIHISRQTYRGLQECGGYHMTLRGDMNIRGKGLQKTYWLHGKQGYDKTLPVFDSEDAQQEDAAEKSQGKDEVSL